MFFTDQNGLTYQLDKSNFTCKIVYSPNVKDDIIVPRSIKYETSDYIITGIEKCSFRKNFSIRSITFSLDSELQAIEKKAFSVSSVSKISFPSSLKELKKGWCEETNYLYNVQISPKDKSYVYLDNQMIIGKSNSSVDHYDILVFVRRDIEEIKIPSFIKHIDPYAFDGCSKLQSIKFSKESELLSLGKCSLAGTHLSNINIPPKFNNFEEGWCQETLYLTDVDISPENHLYSKFDDDFVLGKSDPSSDCFDSLIFSSRNITKTFIPSFIKYINPFAFEECEYLDSIRFAEDSKLISIGKCAFFSTGIRKIVFPNHLKFIGKSAFYDCSNLRKIVFPNDSDLVSIGKKAFNDCSVRKIVIPKKVELIGVLAFSFCSKLKNAEILSESLICDESCFKSCHCLTLISFPYANKIKIAKNAFENTSKKLLVFVHGNSQMEIF